jgi:hypothetical protein
VKFGRSEVSRKHFVGRRVDLMARALPVDADTEPIGALRQYLRERRTRTAQELAKKAVVLLEPEPFFGTVVWPA